MNFLFWNIRNKNLIDPICNIVRKYNIDIIILAESGINKTELVLSLNKDSADFYPPSPFSYCEKLQIFTKFDYNFIKPIYESSRITIRTLKLPLTEEILITAIHLVDKRNNNEDSQNEMASIIIKEIALIEKKSLNDQNIIIGDFNMNPFELGLIKANGFNATMASSIASNKEKIIQGIPYSYLYNPMWSLFGDLYNEPIGSYYYPRSEIKNYQWNIFDQVLLRSSLVSRFNKKSLQILKDDGINQFLSKKGIPKKNKFSDHLPITFSLNLKN